MDNASADGTPQMLAQSYPHVRTLRLERNEGPPVARNIGMPLCKGEFIYLLDDDGWLEPSAVENCVNTIINDATLGVVSSHIYEMREGQLICKRPNVQVPTYQGGFGAGCSLYRKSAFTRVGLWPTDFFRQGEEPDLALRLLDDGLYCLVQPASIMYHEASTVGRDRKLFIYYLLRNTNKSALRHWPFPWCGVKVGMNFFHALRFMFAYRFYSLPFRVLSSFIQDLLSLRGRRKPVRAETMRIFLQLRDNPSMVKPPWASNSTTRLAQAAA